MKYIISIGKPTHFKVANSSTACGLHGNTHYAAWDGRDVECLRCRKTKAWKKYMGEGKELKKTKQN